MKETNGNCVVLFIKEPIRGRVKTRLAAAVGADCTVELYKCFVEDIVSMLEGLSISTRCYCLGSGSTEALQNWLGRRHSYLVQSGDGLGRRMANALRDAFAAGFSKAVLIGSDLPDLPCDIIRQAFAALDAHDAVIGPSSDGGYYLIGFSAPHLPPGVFEDVPWGTDCVFERTMEILNGRGIRTCVLPQWHDVDTWSDVEDLIRRNTGTSFRGSRTWAFVRKYGWVSGEEERSEGNV